jgi:glucose/arabinose dehydrogenase
MTRQPRCGRREGSRFDRTHRSFGFLHRDQYKRARSAAAHWFLMCAAAALAARPAIAQPPAINLNGATIRLQPIVDIPGASGAPTVLTQPNDGTGRLFVAGQSGIIDLIAGGVLSATPFLDIPDSGVTLEAGGEKGLLGLAFHPNFSAPEGTPGRGKLYTYTSEPQSGAADFMHETPSEQTASDHYSVVREWTVDPDNPNLVDVSAGADSSRVLMKINEPQSNHNGGALVFGPENDLYITLGDGGGGNDNNGSLNLVGDGHTNGTGNAQDLNNVYGKILRIDPLGVGPTSNQYGIPATNPFAGATAGVDEIYAYGLRNPFRISFDTATGLLYAGDVGQGQREEIDQIVSGGNYGWVYWEGTRANRAGGPAFGSTVAPLGEYTHSDGNAVIGGFVYRGSLLGPLVGKYVFGDLAGNANLGRLFYLDLGTHLISEFKLPMNGVGIPGQLYSIGADESGELYALFSSGDVLKLTDMPGDVNLDGAVDIFDVNLVSAQWGQAGPLGDANHDGTVNIFDVNWISSHWTGTPASPVPEPSTIALAALAVIGLAIRWVARSA